MTYAQNQPDHVDPGTGGWPHRPNLSRRQAKFLRDGLRRLGHRTYSDYLDSVHWQGLRLRYAASGRPKRCAVCHDPAYELHHRTYRRLGRERLDDLVPLCHRHHEAIHAEGLPLWDGYRVLRERERSRAPSDVREHGVDGRGPGPCRDCDGLGYVGSLAGWEECAPCGGSGVLPAPEPEPRPEPEVVRVPGVGPVTWQRARPEETPFPGWCDSDEGWLIDCSAGCLFVSDGGIVEGAFVAGGARRRGIATALFLEAERRLGPLDFNALTRDGKKWARTLGYGV